MFKKSQIGSTIALIGAILLVFFILLVFLSLVSLFPFSKLNKGEVAKYSEQQQEFVSLQAYLNTALQVSLEGDEKEFTIKDIIRLWALGNNQYRAILETESRNIFDKFSNEGPCYYLKVDNEMVDQEISDRRVNAKGDLSILEIGNLKLASKDGLTLEIPLLDYKKSEIKLIINSLCMEK